MTPAEAAPTVQHQAQLSHAVIQYRERGSGGPPVVFVHALLLDSRLWLEQLDGLCGTRRCVAPDLSGHGDSSPLTAETIDYPRYVDELIEFMDHVGIKDKAHIVGLSAGGNLAIMLCNRAPERCRSLTLISTTMNTSLDAATLRYRRENARTVVLEGKDTLFRRFNEYIVSPTASLHARARYRSMLEQTPYETLVAFFNTESSPNASTENIRQGLPVMIPIGSADSVVSEELAQRYARYFDLAQIVVLPSAGRLLPLESPEKLNVALQSFWGELN